ncbi:class I SAM-dependent DNA methyltransferase [Photobacterium gaetbulicola]|uniref:class I SAM-dependent DNA methyltransferase n=1 Tax=Photobacterium gaetbulicola TaxID=1295392 RepID=UPI0009DEDC1E|nr:class I SAM-dependent methyltransferase [Photobacterium gaetbulicola]
MTRYYVFLSAYQYKERDLSQYFDSVASDWDTCPAKVERAEITAAKIKEIHFESTRSIVDFGSGTGLLGFQLKDTFSHVHLADASEKMLQVAQAKIAAANINNIKTHQIERLSELTSKHSAIVTLMTLHHLPDVDEFFTDAYGVLEDDGMLIVADLYEDDGSFHKHNPNFDGHNGFNVSALSAIAENAGFTVQQIEQYYEIWQENFEGVEVSYPLFLFVVKKS